MRSYKEAHPDRPMSKRDNDNDIDLICVSQSGYRANYIPPNRIENRFGNRDRSQSREKPPLRCFKCQSKFHLARDCRNKGMTDRDEYQTGGQYNFGRNRGQEQRTMNQQFYNGGNRNGHVERVHSNEPTNNILTGVSNRGKLIFIQALWGKHVYGCFEKVDAQL